MNDLKNQTYPMSGSITDFNVWDRKLKQSEIREWSQCLSTESGRTVSWEEAKLGNQF